MALMVTIDPELCVGSGDCVRLLPAAFELDEERGVSVARPAAGECDRRTLLIAAFGCPTQAIRVVDPDGTVLHASNAG